jgi:hypothetical protein
LINRFNHIVQAVQIVQVVQSSGFAGFVQIAKTVFLPFSPGCLLSAASCNLLLSFDPMLHAF